MRFDRHKKALQSFFLYNYLYCINLKQDRLLENCLFLFFNGGSIYEIKL